MGTLDRKLPKLIGICGPAGAGKSTAAKWFVEEHDYVRIPFAGRIKSCMRAMGLSEEEINGKLKEVPSPMLCWKSPRYAMQTLGTEWGREMIGEEFWLNLWRRDAERTMSLDGFVIVDDVRFPNEYELVRKLGGCMIRVIRASSKPISKHESEAHWKHMGGFSILNNMDKKELYAALKLTLTAWSRASERVAP